MASLTRAWLAFVVWLNAHLESAAVRLTCITGKSPVPLHPKHLLTASETHWWYLRHLHPTDRLLDIGCGSGSHTSRASEQVTQAFGLDRDHNALRSARRITSGHVSNLTLLQASAEAPLPFCDGAFGVVLLLDVIEHLNARVALLREVHRILRPDGRLLLSAPNRDTTWKRKLRAVGLAYYADPDHKIEYTLDELLHELAAGGFEPADEPQLVVYDTPWTGVIDFVGGLSLSLYRRLAMWKVGQAQAHPEETTGWRLACRKLPSSQRNEGETSKGSSISHHTAATMCVAGDRGIEGV
jgi:SAM-dependent methyltransferase